MADENIVPLASLSLTHVYYDPSDPVSYLCAFLALVPQALCVVYATLLWSSREAEVALMFAGQLACEAVNFVLKRIIKEERPARIHGKGYGMPSSHAQFAFFWAVAVTLFLVARHNPHLRSRPNETRTGGAAGNGSAGDGRRTVQGAVGGRGAHAIIKDVETYAHQPWSLLERVLVSGVAVTLAGMVAWSRVYLGYHTPKQVLAGCMAGALSAVAWFGITHVIRQTGLLAWALEASVARWFRLRDLVIEEDFCQAGWDKWEDRKLDTQHMKTQ